MPDNVAIYSRDAEAAVLGAVLINPNLLTEISLAPEDFYVHTHADLWRAARAIHDQGSPVDLLTLSDYLTRHHQLEKVGGTAYLMTLVNQTPTTLHADAYASIVREKARRRNLIRIAQNLATAAYDEKTDLDQLTPTLIEQISGIARIGDAARPLQEYLSELWDTVSERARNPVDVWGIPTGIATFDLITGGLQPGELEILSGVPGVGKSMLAMQRAMSMAEHAPGAIYSLEMNGLAVTRRLVSAEASIPARAMKTGLMDDEWSKLTAAIERLGILPVYLSDHSEWTTAQLRADLARLKAQANIQWFLVDYLYLLRDSDDKDEITRTTQISRSLKRICRQLKLAGTAVHSMNKGGLDEDNDERDASRRRSGPPANSSLRGSGQVVYDADLITFLTGYKPRQVMEVIPESRQKQARVLWITKGRELESTRRYVLLMQRGEFPGFTEYTVLP